MTITPTTEPLTDERVTDSQLAAIIGRCTSTQDYTHGIVVRMATELRALRTARSQGEGMWELAWRWCNSNGRDERTTPQDTKDLAALLTQVRSAAKEEAARVAEGCEVTLNGDDPFGNIQIANAIRSIR